MSAIPPKADIRDGVSEASARSPLLGITLPVADQDIAPHICQRAMGGLLKKIVSSQYHRPVGTGLFLEELTRCTLFNYSTHPHKLIYALIWPYVTPTFKILHRCGADRAQNYLALIEHRELND
jgi:hypothetical protein